MKPPRGLDEQSSEAVHQRAALEELSYLLSELAANLLRVVRGAGKPYEIGSKLAACTHAFHVYKEAHGHWPSSEVLAGILKFRSVNEDFDLSPNDGSFDRADAEYEVCRGVLQIVASRILDQRTQEVAGRSELYEGIRRLNAARIRRRRADCP